MFDPLEPARLVAMLGDLLRDSARWDRPLDEFRSAQLLSASSVARHLAAELAGADAERAWLAGRVAEVLAADPGGEPAWAAVLDAARGRAAAPGADLGSVLVEVLRAARAHPGPVSDAFRAEVRGLLAELVHRHVAMLEDAT